MTDEKYLFIQDVRDKKRTARSSHNRRTHAGKSGGVKLPSDYLTKKEREKMNGEPTTYRINSPMTWDEFKAIPDDLKVLYVGWIRDTFGATDKAIAEMLGVDKAWFSKTMRLLGAVGPKRGPRAIWDTEGFAAWCNSVAADETAAAEPAAEAKTEAKDSVAVEPVYTLRDLIEEASNSTDLPFIHEEIEPEDELIPTAGWMNFEGPADQALRAIGNVLGNANVRLHVSWNPINTEDTQDGGR